MSKMTMRGFSSAARVLDDAERGLFKRRHETVTFSRQPAYDALWDVWQPCKVENWDGEGGAVVDHETYQNAYRLIEALPSGYPSPSVTAEPDGCLSLEWYRHPRQLLTASVSPEGTLYWAALVGSEDPRGSCQFFDAFPPTLLYWIGRVFRG